MGLSGGACPCGSGKPFAGCCARYLDGADPAPTAEALMRSRYTAYALGRMDYVRETWHPATRPTALAADPAVRWIGLRVKRVEAGGEEDAHGVVEFVARSKRGGRASRLAEASRFTRLDGRWVYVDGAVEPPG
ncbi:MAG: YchJ family protein [Gammaproteobacteria bacterium]